MLKATLMTAALLLLTAVSASTATPNVMSYQGRLLDNIGDAVTDGVYSVQFTIYDDPVAGNSKWTETQNVTTSGGLFSVVLGSINPIADSVFNGADRYLGITVEADPELSPRTQLTTSPYAQRISTVDGSTGGSIAGDVDVSSNSVGNAFSVTQSGGGRGGFFQIANGGNTEAAVQGTHVGAGPGGSFFSDGGGAGIEASATGGTAAELFGRVNTYGDQTIFDGADTAMHVDASASMIRTFGSDGLEQIRLWGVSYGELQLRDAVDNDIAAELSASSDDGGWLRLSDDIGIERIVLSGNSAQDASVTLPAKAINALETGEEAGVANRIQGVNAIPLTGGQDTIVVRTITLPAAGYVLAIGSVNIQFVHTSGIQDYTRMRVGLSGGSTIDQFVRVGTGSNSANWEIPTTLQGLFTLPAGAHQFCIVAEEMSGTQNVYSGQLTLIYFPTEYGIVTSNTAVNEDSGPTTSAAELSYSTQMNDQRIAAEIEAMRDKLNQLEAQLETQGQQQ